MRLNPAANRDEAGCKYLQLDGDVRIGAAPVLYDTQHPTLFASLELPGLPKCLHPSAS